MGVGTRVVDRLNTGDRGTGPGGGGVATFPQLSLTSVFISNYIHQSSAARVSRHCTGGINYGRYSMNSRRVPQRSMSSSISESFKRLWIRTRVGFGGKGLNTVL